MSRRGNWDRLRVRDQMRRYGSESVNGDLPELQQLIARARRPRWSRPPYRPPPTKAELRAQAAAAFVAWRRQHASDPLAPRLQGDSSATPGDVAPPWE
jgi:hypothetical protein